MKTLLSALLIISLPVLAQQPQVVLTPRGQVIVVYDYTTGAVKAILPVSKPNRDK